MLRQWVKKKKHHSGVQKYFLWFYISPISFVCWNELFIYNIVYSLPFILVFWVNTMFMCHNFFHFRDNYDFTILCDFSVASAIFLFYLKNENLEFWNLLTYIMHFMKKIFLLIQCTIVLYIYKYNIWYSTYIYIMFSEYFCFFGEKWNPCYFYK